jgi:hypothetical protein
MNLNHLSLPPLEKGRVGEGIALCIVRPLSVARDPLLAFPFQGEEVRQSGLKMV